MTNGATGTHSNANQPTGKVRVIMYDVGFGDSFLLSFEYKDGTFRHVLIDCGTRTETAAYMTQVVDQIKQDCGGKLHALVVTHRHLDHLSAFGSEQTGPALEELQPDLVVQPWTEHPDAAANASEAPSVFTNAALVHLKSLAAAQGFAQQLASDPGRLLDGVDPDARRGLGFVAALSLHNQQAVDRLANMGTQRAYVYANSESGLDSVLPGVRVTVLGPPTLEQSKDIRHEASDGGDEFWKLWAQLASPGDGQPPQSGGRSRLFPDASMCPVAEAASYVKWAINRLDRANEQNVNRLVTALDKALNNTSVVLLFEVAGKALLFPGDAQVENWEYGAQCAGAAEGLPTTNLYKVGHHGSGNATPKQLLWERFLNRKATAEPGRLITLLSTRQNQYPGRVPRKSLVKALQAETDFHTTEAFAQDELSATYVL